LQIQLSHLKVLVTQNLLGSFGESSPDHHYSVMYTHEMSSLNFPPAHSIL